MSDGEVDDLQPRIATGYRMQRLDPAVVPRYLVERRGAATRFPGWRKQQETARATVDERLTSGRRVGMMSQLPQNPGPQNRIVRASEGHPVAKLRLAAGLLEHRVDRSVDEGT